MSSAQLASRYGVLYDAVCAMPSKVSVDVEQILREYLSLYIHHLQITVASNPTWQLTEVQAHMRTIHSSTAKLFTLEKLERGMHKEFNASVGIAEMSGGKPKFVRVNHQTNAGMGEFKIESV